MNTEFLKPDTWEPLESIINIPCNSTREELEQNSLASSIDFVLDTLTGREKYILVQRFFYNKTQSEVAQSLNLSTSRIAHIEHRALRKLRHPLIRNFLLEDNRINIAALKQYKDKETPPTSDELFVNKIKRILLSKRAKSSLGKRRQELARQREERRKAFEEREAQDQKRRQENEAYFKREYAKQVARNELIRKDRETYERMICGNGVPKGIYLNVTQNKNGDIVYSLIALPRYESVLNSVHHDVYNRWIDLLKQRAKWMEENCI